LSRKKGEWRVSHIDNGS